MKNSIFMILSAVLMATGCVQGKKAEHFTALPFPDQVPPEMMTAPQDRMEYLAGHYWDGITDPDRAYPSDSLLVSGVRKTEVERKFADWTSVLDMVSMKTAGNAVSRLYDRAVACERKDTSSNVFETFTYLMAKYFYDPNSPLRNEERYLPYVSRLSSFEDLSPEMRRKYEYQTEMCSKNRIGEVAADFRFADRYGRIHTLHEIDAPLVLLFFSNPGCDACMNIIEVLKGDPLISGKVADGSLAVVNIYIDEDLQSWKDYMPVYPDEWYNGFDPDLVIRTDNLYSVRAIPSLYLLDEEKRVIMKDAPEDRVFAFLSR